VNKQVTLIFPHQLFRVHPAIKEGSDVYMVEDHLYFRQYNFHKKKLILHLCCNEVLPAVFAGEQLCCEVYRCVQSIVGFKQPVSTFKR
jgi:hypothetical protein